MLLPSLTFKPAIFQPQSRGTPSTIAPAAIAIGPKPTVVLVRSVTDQIPAVSMKNFRIA